MYGLFGCVVHRTEGTKGASTGADPLFGQSSLLEPNMVGSVTCPDYGIVLPSNSLFLNLDNVVMSFYFLKFVFNISILKN